MRIESGLSTACDVVTAPVVSFGKGFVYGVKKTVEVPAKMDDSFESGKHRAAAAYIALPLTVPTGIVVGAVTGVAAIFARGLK